MSSKAESVGLTARVKALLIRSQRFRCVDIFAHPVFIGFSTFAVDMSNELPLPAIVYCSTYASDGTSVPPKLWSIIHDPDKKSS